MPMTATKTAEEVLEALAAEPLSALERSHLSGWARTICFEIQFRAHEGRAPPAALVAIDHAERRRARLDRALWVAGAGALCAALVWLVRGG